MSNDEIKIKTDVKLTDSNGQPVNVKTQSPEYLVETFSLENDKDDNKEQ